jgi:hypothetical protein
MIFKIPLPAMMVLGPFLPTFQLSVAVGVSWATQTPAYL